MDLTDKTFWQRNRRHFWTTFFITFIAFTVIYSAARFYYNYRVCGSHLVFPDDPACARNPSETDAAN
ncbi:hypothetical protein [Ruegeria sp.]|uniref:hypothetical protein n=1 Tax=Ruegeria sp. TaxID=1879320 RepID=UPI003AFFE63A